MRAPVPPDDVIVRGIRLLVLDVDGTLIGSAGEPSPAVRAAIAEARSAGVAVALCSGRPMASCGPIARSLGLTGPHVTFNGALVQDPDRREAVLRRPLPASAVDRLIDATRREALCLELYTETTHYVERDWRESRLHALSIRVSYELADFDAFRGRSDLIKAQIITSDDRSRRATRRLADGFAGELRLSVAIPMAPCEGMECVNVVERSVSKGTAVRALIDFYGLQQREVAGVGDAPNDLPMLAEVGWKVAMGNAEPALKAQADYICGDVDADGLVDGIAFVLDRPVRVGQR